MQPAVSVPAVKRRNYMFIAGAAGDGRARRLGSSLHAIHSGSRRLYCPSTEYTVYNSGTVFSRL